MAIRQIVQIGDETLRKRSFEVVNFDNKLASLLDDMRDTLKKSGGVGLAAPQVGILRRIFIVEVEENKIIEFINPTIIKQSGSQTGEEGCLSVIGKYGIVTRPDKVKIKAFDRFGNEFEYLGVGFNARALCHEYDHLDGIIYVDKAEELYSERR